MSYQVHHQCFNPEVPNPEESEVLTALAGYDFQPEDEMDLRWFVPTLTLYRAYLDHCGKFRRHVESPQVLSLVLFGIALRRVFALAPDRKTRRWAGGKPLNGYVGVTGPGAVCGSGERGRPKKVKK